MAESIPHPTEQQLLAFCLGSLPPQEAYEVEAHIDVCSPCCQALLSLSSNDTFVELLKASTEKSNSPTINLPVNDEPPNPTSEEVPPSLHSHSRYRIAGLIGRGGMGNVYKAQHRLMERTVAIKIINPAFVSRPEAIERFHREVKAAARLNHPNIVAAYDAERAGQDHFLVTEFVDGMDLAKWINQRGRLPVNQACSIVRQAALGLQHAFERGMIHRDIKPHNLMITATAKPQDPANFSHPDAGAAAGREAEYLSVKILDFGLASLGQAIGEENDANSPDGQLTHAGTIMGTPDFISPEQAIDASAADIRSDIYSLGATLYYCLSGYAPFADGSLTNKLKRLAQNEPKPIQEIRPDITAPLAQVISRMMAKSAEERFQTPADVANALLPYCASGGNPPLSVGTSAGRPLRGTIVVAAISLLVLLAVFNPFTDALRISDGTSTDAAQTSLPEPNDGSGSRLGNSESIGTGIVKEQTSSTHSTSDSELTTPSQPPSSHIATTGDDSSKALPAPSAPVSYVYYTRELSKLEFTGNDSVGFNAEQKAAWEQRHKDKRWVWTYAIVESDGEAFITPPPQQSVPVRIQRIAIRAPRPSDLTARLVMPTSDGNGLHQIAFDIRADEWKSGEADRRTFLQAKRDHYQYLVSRNLPGTAWFRHQAEAADQAMGIVQEAGRPEPTDAATLLADNTFTFLSGNRAINESLRLEQLIQRANSGSSQVDVDSITGITINPFDFTALTRELTPQKDPLAKLIPKDQHAFFFGSFGGLLQTLDYASSGGLRILQLARLESERRNILQLYQAQLGLELNSLARQLGPQFVKSLAITGGDVYFEAGTDVAILFEPTDGGALNQLIAAQIALTAKQHATVQFVDGMIDDVSYTGYVSPDRSLSSYQARIAGAVVVSNSLAQLQRLIRTANHGERSIASTAEYKFFRHRYPITADDASSLLVISDATIRRWCGPRLRIGASRRRYAAAALADAQAHYIDKLLLDANGTSADSLGDLAKWEPVCGQLQVTPTGMQSEIYGNLNFLTPIIELDLAQVTRGEAQGYERWRNRYESQWRRKFDPIAIHFTATPNQWSADVTVVPLTASSDYSWFVSLTEGAKVSPRAADPHAESVMHTAVAINKESPLFGIAESIVRPNLPAAIRIDPFAWFGSTISLYADDSPIWQLMTPDDRHTPPNDLPVAVSLEVVDATKMLPFLVGLRSYLDQTLPGLIAWNTRQYGEFEYTQITISHRAAAQAREQGNREFILYYAITGSSLVFSPNEQLIQRAFARSADKNKATENTGPREAGSHLLQEDRWLGEHLTFQLDGEFLPALESLTHSNFQRELESASWRNLPILNDWRRHFPQTDPVEKHRELFGRELFCVGGRYRWNDAMKSMESTVFGPPGSTTESGSPAPLPFQDAESALFGITFEHGGLRARMRMQMKE